MGYYPLPESEARILRSLLTFSKPASVIDPCVGEGIALHLLTSGAPVRRCGVDLSPPDGQEDVGRLDDGGQVLR